MAGKLEFNSPDYHRSWLGHKVIKYCQRIAEGRALRSWFVCECGMEWHGYIDVRSQ